MLRLSLALAVLVFLSAGDTAHATLSFEPGTKTNVLSVSYSAIPDPLNWFSFFPMPRTLAKAQSDKFALVGMRDDSKTTVWCRDKDYRVCLLFDGQGSVAGLQMALAVKDLQDVKTQFDSIPEWQRQIYLGEDVYIATVFFVSKDVLLGGGRALVDDTPTAPDGIYIQLKNGSLLHASTKQEEALKADFHEQNCHNGMGKHYFQVSKSTACETMRPVFLLFGPQGPLAGKLIGFGFSVFGKPSSTRNWFESSSTSMIKRVVPNSPPCLEKWTKAHGLTTFHVYFVDNAYYIRC